MTLSSSGWSVDLAVHAVTGSDQYRFSAMHQPIDQSGGKGLIGVQVRISPAKGWFVVIAIDPAS